MSADGFATLIPAFTLRGQLDPPVPTGPTATYPGGLTLVNVPSGTLVSEPSYPISINAQAINAVDFITQDKDGRFLRLDVRAFFTEIDGNGKGQNATIAVFYKGQIELNESIGAILTGAEGAKTTEFGNVRIQLSFTAGGEKYKKLEENLYVGNGRFVVEGEEIFVEYKISQIAS